MSHGVLPSGSGGMRNRSAIGAPASKSRANPVGVTYDPEQLAHDYEAGVPVADLLRIPPLPAGKTPWDMLSQH